MLGGRLFNTLTNTLTKEMFSRINTTMVDEEFIRVTTCCSAAIRRLQQKIQT